MAGDLDRHPRGVVVFGEVDTRARVLVGELGLPRAGQIHRREGGRSPGRDPCVRGRNGPFGPSREARRDPMDGDGARGGRGRERAPHAGALDLAELVSRLATVLLTSATPHAGLEHALVELCEFLEVDRATAFIVQRDWPHDLDDFVSVTHEGERRTAAPVLVEARALMVTVVDDDGLSSTPRADRSRRPGARSARPARRRSAVACRSATPYAVLGLMSLQPHEWSEEELQMLRISRLVGHSQPRSVLDRQVRGPRDTLAASEARLQAMIDGAPASIFRGRRESSHPPRQPRGGPVQRHRPSGRCTASVCGELVTEPGTCGVRSVR